MTRKEQIKSAYRLTGALSVVGAAALAGICVWIAGA